MVSEWILSLLARDFVNEKLCRKAVGQEADSAKGIGAYPGVAIELFHQLMRHIVALEVRTQHGDEILAARRLYRTGSM